MQGVRGAKSLPISKVQPIWVLPTYNEERARPRRIKMNPDEASEMSRIALKKARQTVKD